MPALPVFAHAPPQRQRSRARLQQLCLGLATALPLASQAGCDLAAFDRVADKACARSSPACLAAYLPTDISGIRRGVVIEWVGLAVNDGRARWHALDLDRRELWWVERYAGRRLGQAPVVAVPGAQEYRVDAVREGAPWVDHVRRYALDAAQAEALACLAVDGQALTARPEAARSDGASRFYLLLAQTAQTQSALSPFSGPLGELSRAMSALTRPPAEGAPKR